MATQDKVIYDDMEPMSRYVAAPPLQPRDKEGNIDPRCPDEMLGPNARDHFLAIVTTGENRHPDEDALMDTYVRQQVAKKQGTYDPLKDPPVLLYDLTPRVFVVINRIFSEREITRGGEKMIKDYMNQLKAHTDYDITECYVGRQVLLLPLHFDIPKDHRDPVMHAHMEGYYKNHTEQGNLLMQRVIKAQEEAVKKRKEFKEQEDKKEAERARLLELEKKQEQENQESVEPQTNGENPPPPLEEE